MTDDASSGDPALRVLLVNENVGGHAAMHFYLRRGLAGHPEVTPQFLDLPRPGLARRIVAAAVPGLAGLDLDLQPLRQQLAGSLWVRRRLRGWPEPYDVLHVYTQHAALLSAAELRAHPSVVSTDGTTAQIAYRLPHRRPTRWTASNVRIARRFYEDAVYRAATLVVAQSEWAAASLREVYGVPEERLRVIPFGVSVDPEQPSRRPRGLPEITFVGTTMGRKGGWRLLSVFRRHLRGRCVLNLVTRERVASEQGVRVFADFVPGDPRLAPLLGGTNLFVFPSEVDTFGYAPLEAMAAGVPVVANRVAALPEIVADGVTGLLVEPYDDDALCDAVVSLLEDPDRQAAMGRAARERVLERFDTRVTTTQLIDVLHEARHRFEPRGAT